jgi:uncharacterized membrane protein
MNASVAFSAGSAVSAAILAALNASIIVAVWIASSNQTVCDQMNSLPKVAIGNVRQ